MSENSAVGAGGILYVVGLPIGNPRDISERALEVLAQADLIACEDTRRTGRILTAHSIRTPTTSFFEHNEQRRTPAIIERLRAGANVALVTDAGTPAISDPGYRLVRAAHEAGIGVVAVPGASAAIAALSIAGIPTDRFVFEGFLPAKAGARRSALGRLAREERTMVFFEAARRLEETLREMAVVFGADRVAAVVRELTKTHEETVRGTLAQLADRFVRQAPLGEITLVVAGTGAAAEPRGETVPALDETRTVEVLCEAGLSLKQAAAAVANLTGRSRREIYQNAIRSRRPIE
ncbi:MAG TPA: 16S rRNA (cytidine(1402)-2'-O)-methyltransferase [Candidatus Binataceae bacterium]|nr:16S rRNA (cytidine(1402)-2'-O)-methyltransferase [Candidatus Binataceae bacterium]